MSINIQARSNECSTHKRGIDFLVLVCCSAIRVGFKERYGVVLLLVWSRTIYGAEEGKQDGEQRECGVLCDHLPSDSSRQHRRD